MVLRERYLNFLLKSFQGGRGGGPGGRGAGEDIIQTLTILVEVMKLIVNLISFKLNLFVHMGKVN